MRSLESAWSCGRPCAGRAPCHTASRRTFASHDDPLQLNTFQSLHQSLDQPTDQIKSNQRKFISSLKFFTAFNYIYACVGSTASPMLLCYLLHTFCLPILLYGHEAVAMSNANLRTLYLAWKTALYKIFKLNNDANLLYTQCCFGVLPINFVLDLRQLCFLSKQRCDSISVHNVFYDMFGFYEFNRLCSEYSVCGQSRGYFSASVWDVFRDLVFWLLYWLYCFSSGLSVCLYTLLCE